MFFLAFHRKSKEKPPESAQPRLSSLKSHRPNTPKFVASHRGENKHTQICTLAGDDCRLTYSNWAVQIRVGLELAESASVSITVAVIKFRLPSAPAQFCTVETPWKTDLTQLSRGNGASHLFSLRPCKSYLRSFSLCFRKENPDSSLVSEELVVFAPREGSECTAVAAIWLRMRMRLLVQPENPLANFSHQISNKKLRANLRCLRQNSLAIANAMAWCTQ